MESYWKEVRREGGTVFEKSSKNDLAKKWGLMCENRGMATYISKFLSRTFPNSKVYETVIW